ncbi:MAG: hypothetical protein CMP23_12250 [Rickettsiales bacterium]|nr:hypothetical protein [Rickettsiales bacterium]|tara:strand:- start:105 stop:863 length:759 start_codon:yes stop_codon:yes gene_type:complete
MLWRRLNAALLCAALGGCAHLPTPEGPPGPSKRDALYLDAEPAPSLLIEIDRVEGTAPRPRALATFLTRVERYLDKPEGIRLVVDDVIPVEEWQEGHGKIRALARRYRSVQAKAPEHTAVLHMIYAPRMGNYRGYCWSRKDYSDTVAPHDEALVLLLQGNIKPILWITGAKQEASVLIHELGHALGLSSNPGHSYKGHCTKAHCLMYDGVDVRTFLLYFFPTLLAGHLPLDYCSHCRADLYPGHDGKAPGDR